MAPKEQPGKPAQPRKDDPPDPGNRSGEGSASIHDHMERDRGCKNEDEADRSLIGSRGEARDRPRD
jgi:hypothetical protein